MGTEFCTSNIGETMVMLPSHLLYFPGAGKALSQTLVLPLRPFR